MVAMASMIMVDTILCHNVLDSSVVGGAVCFKRTPFCNCMRYKIEDIICSLYHKNTKQKHQKEYNKWKTLLELCYTEIVIRNECFIILYEI